MIQTAGKPVIPPASKQRASAAIRADSEWDLIKWDYHTQIVRKLQLRIAKATQAKEHGKVRSLQWILTHSRSAKLLAVRKVMSNTGSKTPGVDGITIKTPEEKLALAKNLTRHHYHPLPLRRIYIPKAGNKQKLRPISIPTIKDRAMQALHTLALLPVAEQTADPNSYGFRPERNCADAIEQCFKALPRQTSPTYILEGDIKGCFDNISHDWMIENICMDSIILSKWLRAGYVHLKKLFPTTEGAAQGGIISPTICNMVLDGMTDMLKANFKRHKGITLVRYADDFIVTSYSKELLEQEIRPAIEAFLKERGLELSKEKTRITQIGEGFDFLGQNVRKYPDHGKQKLLIKPSQKNIHSFLEAIRKVFRKARSMTAAQLIQILNSKIRGWANYHRSVVAKATFTKIDNTIWHLSYQWVKRRHPKKGSKWLLQKYYKKMEGVNHRFYDTEIREDGTIQEFTLLKMAYTPIRRHVKIQGQAHPFDSKYDEYFEKRTSDKWRRNSKHDNVITLISRMQQDQCPCCKEKLTINQYWYISLKCKTSVGGEYKFGNIDIVHAGCYDKWQPIRNDHTTVKPVTDIKDDLVRARAG